MNSENRKFVDAFGNSIEIDGDYLGCTSPEGNLLALNAIPSIRAIFLNELPDGESGIQVCCALSNNADYPESQFLIVRYFFNDPSSAKKLADAIEESKTN